MTVVAMRWRSKVWPLGVAAVAVLIIARFAAEGVHVAGPQLGFPLDDTWIHVRFAQTVARTGVFAFNPGEPTAGSTSPLWVVLLAAVGLFSGQFVGSALLLSALSYFLLGLCTYLVARRMLNDEGAGAVAALIVLVNVRVAWAALSGMEICLAALLALLATALFAAEEAGRSTPVAPGGDAGGGETSRPPAIALPRRLLAIATPIVFGLASLARPEANLLFVLAVFLRLARSCRRDTPIRDLLRLIPCRMIAIYAVVILPWHLFALWSSGSLLPNTFRANYRGLATRLFPAGYYSYYARWLFIRDHPWIYWFVLLGLLTTLRESFRPLAPRSESVDAATNAGSASTAPAFSLSPFGLTLAQIASLWVICYPVASRMVLPMTRHYARYMIPMTPFHAILIVLGFWAILRTSLSLLSRRKQAAARLPEPDTRNPKSDTRHPIPNTPYPLPNRTTTLFCVVLSLAVILSAVPGLLRWSGMYARNVYTINHQQVAMAKWVRAHTPADAVIAAHDVGALGAVSERRVFDLFGLVTPRMIHHVMAIIPTLDTPADWYLRQLQESGATYLVGYPHWLPFINSAPECFREIHRDVLDQVDIAAGLEMIIYQIDRDRLSRFLSKR